MMYLEHFDLDEAPFGITPHTGFFFAGARRGAMLEALVYAVMHDEGIVKVSGEVGSGKTLLCRMLLEHLPEEAETVYLATPSLSRDDILFAIAAELELPDSRTHQAMRALQARRLKNQAMRVLRARLLEIYAAGRRVVVIIDEANAMPPETLEEIRLLSNLESERHKLLHIVLFGQPELDERLSQKDMRQMKDRITHDFTLEPLSRDDVGDYLAFRLRTAGHRGPDLFTPRAVRLIAKASQGLSRRINVLADKSLLAAFSAGKSLVDADEARAAIRDARFSPMGEKRRGIFAATAIVILAAIIAAVSFVWRIEAEWPADAAASAVLARAIHSAGRAPTLGERIAATDKWLENAPDSHYFIQFLSTDANNLSDVRILVDELDARLNPRQIRVYRSRLSGHDRLGVIYGDYASRGEAEAELAKLSGITPAGTPYVRAVVKLK
jgi:type II secretory pathway predicted ATPase ExeA